MVIIGRARKPKKRSHASPAFSYGMMRAMKWDYLIFTSTQEATDPELANSLGQLGADGWELASVTFEVHADDNGDYFERNYFFKRPLADDVPPPA